jgi:transcriptional regulator GlxA family with amidase domain
MNIQMLCLDGVFDSGLSILLDALETANALAEAEELQVPRLQVKIVGLQKTIRTGQGLTLSTSSILPRSAPDLVLVPALTAKMPAPLQKALRRQSISSAGEALRSWHQRGATIGAACTGTFVLASAGLLDGFEATTTWWLASLFRESFPAVKLNESEMLVQSGRCITAGAALGHVDLALCVVRRQSVALASLLARYLLVDHRPSQATFAVANHLNHDDEVVEQFERWVQRNLKTRFALPDVARALGTSERTLSRRVWRAVGKAPMKHVQTLRLQRALHLLRTTAASAESVADAVGYGSGVTLRLLIRKHLHCGIREARRIGAVPMGLRACKSV